MFSESRSSCSSSFDRNLKSRNEYTAFDEVNKHGETTISMGLDQYQHARDNADERKNSCTRERSKEYGEVRYNDHTGNTIELKNYYQERLNSD